MLWTPIKNAILVFFSLILFFFAIEVSLRSYERFFHKIPFFKSSIEYYDPLLGWKGKKIFDDSSENKYKIFVIGDSFTAGCGVKETSLYYGALRKRLDAALFVYGGGGYGTLQEFLALEKYYDQVQPDLIILQVCHNDFINNSHELESKSYFNNNNMVRPYFRNGKIEYLLPRTWGRQKMLLGSYSRVLYRLFALFDRFIALLAKKHYFGMHSIENVIRSEGKNLETFNFSINTTDILVKKIKSKAARTPIVAFAVDNMEPYINEFRAIFKENQIIFIDGIPDLIRDKERSGDRLRLKDNSHWNSEGHQIAGNFLAEELYRLGYHK